MRLLPLALVSAALVFASACGGETESQPDPPAPDVRVTPAPPGAPYDRLSDWHFWEDDAGQRPATDLVPYDVIAPLFSDYTTKFRFVFVPKGEVIRSIPDGLWDFPVGTILVKTFAYAADVREPTKDLRLVETRVLVLQADGWAQHTYLWREDQSDADRLVAGDFVPVDFVGIDGKTVHTEYRVPNTNECKNCHKNDDVVVPLGPMTRQLDRDFDYGQGPENQLEHLVSLGLLDAVGDRAEKLVDYHDESEDLFARVRSYWDSNCSACHRPNGEASTSALFLDWHSTDPSTPANSDANWGVCKSPTSTGQGDCGLEVDVVPGRPDLSIMPCRMRATDLEKRMPPLGSKVVHAEGLALIEEWIASLPPGVCTP